MSASASVSIPRLWRLLRLVIIGAALAAVAPVRAQPTSFHLSDDGAGPSCVFFTTMGQLKWQRRGGDWADAQGVPNGPLPYASQLVRPGQGRPFVEWDVTTLVREWLDGRHANNGVFMRLRETLGSGTVIFHSRESPDVAARPSLKLKWADGSTDRLAPSADTYLDCSTVYSLGQRPDLRVGAQYSAILRFDLPKATQALKSATLYMSSDRQQGGGPTTLQVYRAAPPFAVANGGPRQGLAARFQSDAGIARDPDVLFAEDFDSLLWPLRWRDVPLRGSAQRIDEDPELGFVPLHGPALRVRIAKGKNLGMDLRYYFSRFLADEPEEVFLRYYIRFADDWDPWLQGGKLPGIAGTYGRGGWGMRPTDGYNGWSARTGFARRPREAQAVAGLTALASYVYHAGLSGIAGGDWWDWNLAPSSLLANNRWYCIEQHLKLNQPGQADGVYEAWVDGALAVRKTDVTFRKSAELKIETLWFNVYHGGQQPAPKDLTLYLDQVVVAKRYIGPIVGAPGSSP
ncbi:DNRLRE domain-containing protein [Aquincola sp. S2]|uniref:DNRLRE domain-containing protein n=1 Tax=Pseudaquabacterium terrae TaxID=2732868 RepID=A0ABX2ECX4_9BURK|nr:DNRLRE domain-containing protein [Aquabacterium terrae]NRF66536.1 DNRLRE domain-containing protein [Aquabacterium terrae]